MLAECPCKHCTNETGRKEGCHSACERYVPWKVEWDKVQKEIRKNKDANFPSSGFVLGDKRLSLKHFWSDKRTLRKD